MTAILQQIITIKNPMWQIMMEVKHPDLPRPRFFSLHTIAAMTGRKNLLKLADEMKKSGKVKAQYCPIVKAPVFFSSSNNRYSNSESAWNMIKDFIEKHPYPEIKGFRDGMSGSWSGDGYGKGKYTPGNSAMKEPFIEKDYAYANMVIEELKKQGYTPRIKPYPKG